MTNPSQDKSPIVFAITGASGAAYALRLLQQIAIGGFEIQLTISPSAAQVFRQELEFSIDPYSPDLVSMLKFDWRTITQRWQALSATDANQMSDQIRVYGYKDYFSPMASGSAISRGMVICPCSGSTLSAVVHAQGSNLIHRAADVHLKERRPLVLVPRETPLSSFQLENMHRAAQAGATVLPASPGWYHGVSDVMDLVDFVVARVLDHLKIPNQLIQRWAEETDPELDQ